MYNCHIHIFRDIHIANGFIFLLVRLARTKVGFFILKNTMLAIDPFFKNTSFQKLIRMVDVGRMKSQEAIFKLCDQNYPEDTRYIVMPIDMEYMGAGKVPGSYHDQLAEVERLWHKYPEKIIVFPHIDPRRPNFMNIVKAPYTKGIKLYPPMGYALDDERLIELYEYCNEKGLPILMHCGEDSPTHWKGKKKYLTDLLIKYKIPHNPKHSKKKLAAQLCHPQLIFPLAVKYRNINWKLAHWGSHSAWKEYIENPLNPNNWFVLIKRMIKAFPNIYTDISFTLYDEAYYPELKVMLEDDRISGKVLFGSDFYMVKSVANERKFSFKLRGYLGKENWRKIAILNPEKYLDYV